MLAELREYAQWHLLRRRLELCRILTEAERLERTGRG